MSVEIAPVAKIVTRIVEVYVALLIIKPGDQELTVASVIFAALVVALIEIAFRHMQRRVRQAEQNGTLYRADEFPTILAQALKRAQAEVKVFTYSIPTHEVKETLGLVRGVSDTEASSSRDFRLAEQEALLLMLKQAYDMGANAVVGVTLTTGTYETNGSQWQVATPVYTGTAVRI